MLRTPAKKLLSVIGRPLIFPRTMLRQDPRAALRTPNILVHHEACPEPNEGPVEGWWLQARTDAPLPVLIFAHGNGELIDHWPELLAPLRDSGLHVLLVEYRGYGRSVGRPSETKIVSDFMRFYDWIADQPEVDENRIVFVGRSLGGGVMSQLASFRTPAAMILMSTFTRLSDLAQRQFRVPKRLIEDRFESLDVLQALDLPILIVHGRDDRLIPPTYAEELVDACRRARLIWYEGGHNDCPSDWPLFYRDVREFLTEASLLGAPDYPSD